MNEARPCLFPGFLYYFKGTEHGFWDGYLIEMRTNIPLGTFTPVFMAGDLCIDLLFLPLDGVLLAASPSEYFRLSIEDKTVFCSCKQVLEQNSNREATALDIAVEEGHVLIKSGKWPESRLDSYFPVGCDILVSRSFGNENESLPKHDVKYEEHVKLMLYPPVFRCMSGDRNCSFQLINETGQATTRMTLSGLFVSDDFKGVVKLGKQTCRMDMRKGVFLESERE